MDTQRFVPSLEKSFTKLPPHATQASRLRYAIAQDLADAAPCSFGHECVLTGSASQGITDEDSDIEMVFYPEAFPSSTERERWVQSVGARDIVLDEENPYVWQAPKRAKKISKRRVFPRLPRGTGAYGQAKKDHVYVF